MKRYIATRRFGVIELTPNDNGILQDELGTLYATVLDSDSLDLVDRCGIWPFVIPQALTPDEVLSSCVAHDFMYSSAAYQLYHTREQADQALENMMSRKFSMVGKIFKKLARWFGGRAWENRDTNN